MDLYRDAFRFQGSTLVVQRDKVYTTHMRRICDTHAAHVRRSI
jgi:hypothetical protein